ncbi:MAG TPA: hypothetical protein VK784_06280 [Pseudonocardiaceae bacterium]|nr:hypothetical protein [Pseudonocardiaceae bacterium]
MHLGLQVVVAGAVAPPTESYAAQDLEAAFLGDAWSCRTLTRLGRGWARLKQPRTAHSDSPLLSDTRAFTTMSRFLGTVGAARRLPGVP